MHTVIIMLALAITTLANQAFAAESLQWKMWNVAPYAHSLGEACKKAPEAIDGFSVPAAVKAHFKSVLGASCKDGTRTWLTPGMLLEQMWSGASGKNPQHVMNRKLVGELPVTTSPDGRTYHKGAVAETAKAFSWTFVYEGKTYVLYLPFVCFNWSWAHTPSVLTATDPFVACYKVSLDYRQTPGVVWDENHAARIELHFDELQGADIERLARDPCFKVRDATGIHVPYHRCEFCESFGGQWPPAELAKAVELPEKGPSGVFTAPIAGGVGTVSFPPWVAKFLGVYCVDVEEYAIVIPNYAGWKAVTRFDLVTPDEMRRTLQEGKLNRVLSGIKHY